MYDYSCDYDPPAFYNRATPKARATHRCHECSGAILPGEIYERVRAKWEGYIGTIKTCERCVDLRTWVKNNVPCLCIMHGSQDEECAEAIDAACSRAPAETVGLRFGYLRRKVLRDQFNGSQGRRSTDSVPGDHGPARIVVRTGGAGQ